MKNLLVSFIFISVALFSFTTMAQSPWIIQRATGLSSVQNPQLIFSAVNNDVCWGCSYYSSQFVRTIDGGTHWTVGKIPANSGLIGSRIAAIDSNVAFVILHGATGRGIYKTSDGGLTWARYANAFNQTNSDPLQIFFFDSTNGVCMGNPSGGNWEIYTTSNAGTDWNLVPSANIPAPLAGETALYRGHANGAGNCFWFTTWSGSLYRTSDRGITWAVTRNVLGNNGFSVAFKDSLNGVACTPLSGERISVTSDCGKTWRSVDIKFSSPTSYAINYVKGSNNDYIITSNYNRGEPGYSFNPGTAYSSDGGMTWEVVDKTSRLWIDFAPDGTGWSGGESDSVYKWVGFTDKMIVRLQPFIDRTFAGKNVDSVLFRTTFLNFSGHQFIANLIYSNLGNTQIDSVALYDDGLHGDSLSNDGIYGAYIPPLNVEDYFSLSVSTTEDSTNKYVNTPVSLRFTTVGPVKLDSLSVSQVASTVYSVKPFFRNGGSSYTVNDLKIKISKVDNSITQIIPDTISISSIAPGATAGPANGVNITVGSRFFFGILNLNFDIMSNGWTYWTESTSQTVTGVEDIKQAPFRYNLSQNYPNPFNPSTTIKYSVPKASFVALKVYDILGREIASLVNEEKAAGIYGIKFNASNLSSGVYFYKITAGDFVNTKKFILLK